MKRRKGKIISQGCIGYKTPKELAEAIEDYFQMADEEERPYTVPGMAYYLCFASKQSIYDQEKRNPEFKAVIRNALLRIENQYNELAVKKTSQVAGTIFLLKNFFDYRDKSEVDQTVHYPDIEIAPYKPDNE